MRFFTVVIICILCVVAANGEIPGFLVPPCTEQFSTPLNSFGMTIGANADAVAHFINDGTVSQIRRRDSTGFYPVFSNITVSAYVTSNGETAVVIRSQSAFWDLDANGNVKKSQETTYLGDYGIFLSSTRCNLVEKSWMSLNLQVSTYDFNADNQTWVQIALTTFPKYSYFGIYRHNIITDKYLLAKTTNSVVAVVIFEQLANLTWIQKELLEVDYSYLSGYHALGYNGDDVIVTSLYEQVSDYQIGRFVIYTKSNNAWQPTQNFSVTDLPGMTGPGNAGSSLYFVNPKTFLWGVPQERNETDNAVPTGKVLVFSRRDNGTWYLSSYLHSDVNVAFGIGIAANDYDVVIGGFTIGPPPYYGNFFAVSKCYFDLTANVSCLVNQINYDGLCNSDTPIDINSVYTVYDHTSACGSINATLESFNVVSETQVSAVVQVSKNNVPVANCPVVVTCPQPPTPPVAVPQTPVGAPVRSKPTSTASQIGGLSVLFLFVFLLLL